MDNAVARLSSNAEKLRASGGTMGDPFEISTLRREDFKSHEGKAEGDDVVQAPSEVSTKINRGHQGPAAFLIKASGLDKVNRIFTSIYFLFNICFSMYPTDKTNSRWRQ